MLQQTFCHISGLGPGTEKKLWDAGVHSWGDISLTGPIKLTGACLAVLPQSLEESLAALEKGQPQYFASKLPSNERWRLFSAFREHTAYLDIETTGLDERAEITTIALYDGKDIYHYTNGDNLEDFCKDIQRYKVLVTYNGTGFDLPMIERYFGIKLDHAHIDLRYVLNSLGYKGGLKSCEKQLGLDRGELDGVDGYFAVILWREYKRSGDPKVLHTLLAYNIEDTVNLELLMVEAYNRKLAKTPFYKRFKLDIPQTPPAPFSPDRATIERLLHRY